MTLEEKVRLMTQVTIVVIAKGGGADTEGNIDPAGLKKAVVDNHVVSIHYVSTQMKNETEPGGFKMMIGYKNEKFIYQ